MAIRGQVSISSLPVADGGPTRPPAPSASDYLPVIVYDPAKVGGPGFRTSRIRFGQLLVGPITTRVNPRIHAGAGNVIVDLNDTFISVDKTVAAPTTVVFPLAVNKNGDCVIKDGKGDSATNNITITFTGGELCDGMSTVVISTAFDEMRLMPKPGGGGYYLGK